MRVVSQNSGFSFDFDRTIFWMQDNIIYAKAGTENIVVGKYETEDRAAEVFVDMHKAYSDMPLIFQNVQTSEEVEQMLKEMRHKWIKTILPDEPSKIEQINNSVYYIPEV